MMSAEEMLERARDKLDEWVDAAVRETEKEMFLGDSPRLEYEELRKIHRIDRDLRESGRRGVWADVEYQLSRDEDDELQLETYGVPVIPKDLEGVSVEIDEKTRKRYNNVLSEYGIEVSEKVEQKFEKWRK